VVDMIINSLMYCTHYPSTCNFVVGLEAHDGAHEQPSLHCHGTLRLPRVRCSLPLCIVHATLRCTARKSPG
jgi:hypothetical protein